MRAKDLAVLMLLAAIWGSSYLFIRVAVAPLGPVLVSLLRVVIAAIGLLAWAILARRRAELAPFDRRFLILGTVNAAIPYGLIAFAELHISASLAAILNATTPLFTAAVAASWAGERLTPRAWGGAMLGLAGVAVLVGWNPGAIDGWFALAVIAMLGASLAYGVGSVYAKQRLTGVSPLGAATGQQLGAAVILAPIGLATLSTGDGRDIATTPTIALAIIALGLLCTSVAYLLYFHSIAAVGAVKTSSVTFLIPIFGILWSAIFLGESAPPGTLVGLAMILGGVGIVSGAGIRARLGRARLARQS
jgi:drug/metabolite transporter (DMT)-like permease